jgi:hypothetical protein
VVPKSLRTPWASIGIPLAITGASVLAMPAAAPYGLALGGSILAVWGAMRAGKLSRRLRDAEAALEVEMMTHRELRRTIADQSQRPMIIMDSEPECVKVQGRHDPRHEPGRIGDH